MSAGRTVLVVDDEPDIRESLRDALSDEGYDVVAAANGREALAALPTLPKPCAVILDIIMLIMSGVEFYDTLRARPEFADIPVLVSTSDLTRVPPGLPTVPKPVNLDRLLAAVATLFP